MKKLIAGLALAALALGLLSGCAGGGDGRTVTVQSVALITGTGEVQSVDSYAGKVVSGQTAELKKDEDKKVLEVLVEEGDMVREGDVLFTYDTEAMQLSLEKLRLERENYDNIIAAAENEIKELETQRNSAKSDQKLTYTLQIDGRQADIREAEYNAALKDREIAAMEASMEKTQVVSPIAGRIMSVGETDDSAGGDMMGMYGGGMGTGTGTAFITVMDVGAYRVEGRINELNRGAVYEGMPVMIRSRTGDGLTWRGVVDSIDWENPVSGNNGEMVYYSDAGADEMTSSSSYPFYVTLENTDGLLLGQHVYISLDLGDDEGPAGLYLPSWYIVDEAYVWAADGRDKLEKRAVTLGQYDPDRDTWEILSGLTPEDYIAFPEEDLTEGLPVIRFDPDQMGGMADYGVYEENGMYDEFAYDEYGFDGYGMEEYGIDEYGEYEAYAFDEYGFDEYGEAGSGEAGVYDESASDEPVSGAYDETGSGEPLPDGAGETED